MFDAFVVGAMYFDSGLSDRALVTCHFLVKARHKITMFSCILIACRGLARLALSDICALEAYTMRDHGLINLQWYKT